MDNSSLVAPRGPAQVTAPLECIRDADYFRSARLRKRGLAVAEGGYIGPTQKGVPPSNFGARVAVHAALRDWIAHAQGRCRPSEELSAWRSSPRTPPLDAAARRRALPVLTYSVEQLPPRFTTRRALSCRKLQSSWCCRGTARHSRCRRTLLPYSERRGPASR